MGLLDSLTTTDPLADVFSDTAVLRHMLRFEQALAAAEAHLGLIPPAASDAIASVDRAAFDAAAIARRARASGTITISFVESLIAATGSIAPDAVPYVHFGATSQDVSDSALVLCVRDARAIVAADHAKLRTALRDLSEQHASTVMLARTLLQPAAPTTFGLKAAGWFAAVSRSGSALLAAIDDACVLQFGGASGTLAALGTRGLEVAEEVAARLALPLPDAPWHAHRDRLAGAITACGIYTGVLGKIARDISLLMQFEVAEAAEPGGSSSSMPHKRNPSDCAIALAAAARVPGLVSTFLTTMPQEHERGLGGWHAEAATVAEVVQTTGAALAAMVHAVKHLHIDADAMHRNIVRTGGVVLAERAMTWLAPVLGRQQAAKAIADAIARASTTGTSFVAALKADKSVTAHLDADAFASLDNPNEYLGAADTFRRRLLDSHQDD